MNGCDTAFGCQYSFDFRDYIRLRNSPRSPLKEDPPTPPHDNDTNIFIGLDNSPELTCAGEIFSLFMLAVMFHIEPLTLQGASREPRNGLSGRNDREPWQNEVARHTLLEGLVDLMLEKAPSLFPNRKDARLSIIPAFLYYDLLPSGDPEPAAPAQSQDPSAPPGPPSVNDIL